VGGEKGSEGGKQGRYWRPELKLAVVKAYEAKGARAQEVARAYGVPEACIYKWARRYREQGEEGLTNGRRAKSAAKPDAVREKIAAEVLATKKAFGWFGVSRITQWLRRTKFLPVTRSQVETTLRQAHLVTKRPKKRRRAEVVRFFERAQPNELWQVDITMWTVARGQKVYLIAFLDDYSRYIVGWGLVAAQGSAQVLEVLRNAIGQYGAPKEILSDQGRQFYAWRGKCPFQKELAREGIHHVVSRSHHPQTLGKIEAFWKHLKEEFLSRVVAGSINDLRERLRLWIDSFYNHQRPHQGIEGMVPADRYFKTAETVRQVIQKGIQQNAERLALGKEPVKLFYMVGRMGDQPVVVRQEGHGVVMEVGQRELERVNFKEQDDEKAPTGVAGPGGTAGGEGASDGGAVGPVGGEDDRPDLPGDGPEADPVLPAGGAALEGDGDGGGGEPGAGAAAQRAGRVGGAGPAQPEAQAGSPQDAGALAADAKTLPNGPAGGENRPSAEGAPTGGPAAGGAAAEPQGEEGGRGHDRSGHGN
jgi:transposase InsO family protein